MLQILISEGTVRISDLPERLGVSLMTVHRDLDELESQDLARKEHGQATVQASSLLEANWAFRIGQNVAWKESLADAALGFIHSGRSVILDDSTTGVYLARRIPQRQPVTVFTNFLAVASELKSVKGVTLTIFGGEFRGWCNALVGMMALESIRQVRADTVFMSASAITADTCYFHREETVLVKRAMFDSAEQRIIYLDHSKFERRAIYAMCSLRDFDVVIVDRGTPKQQIADMRKKGIHVVVAPEPTSRGGETSTSLPPRPPFARKRQRS